MNSSAAPSQERELAATEVHDVLRNQRRRLTLKRLREVEEPLTVSELAEYVASVESGESPPPENRRQSVYVSLHQTHLPKLDELGIVEYDENNEVQLDERADDVTVYLEVVPQYGLSLNEFNLGLSVLGLLLAVASSLGVPLIAAVPPLVWAVSVLVAIGLVALVSTAKQNETVLGRL